jgi:hypothetical protein
MHNTHAINWKSGNQLHDNHVFVLCRYEKKMYGIEIHTTK